MTSEKISEKTSEKISEEISENTIEKNIEKTTKNKPTVEIHVYIILCLIVANACWAFGYSHQDSDYAMIPIVIASYLPMIVALIMSKITGEGWNNLGIAFHIKNSWRIYILAIIGTAVLTYAAYPLMLLFFKSKVTFEIQGHLLEILLMMLLGTACFIECLGEELGWIGYAFPKLEKCLGTVAACIILGIIRGMYHIGILWFMDFPVHGFIEITVSNIFLSFYMAFMYKKSGSLFPCSISHGISNLLPILMQYDNEWYYTQITPMVVCMLPAACYGIISVVVMRKQGLIRRKNSN